MPSEGRLAMTQSNFLDAAKPMGQNRNENPAAAMGALFGGAGMAKETVDADTLKALLPEAVGALKSTDREGNKVAMGAFKVSNASANYTDPQGGSLHLSIIDGGGTAMFGALAAWSLVEQNRETATGYEKMGKVNGRATHEKFDQTTKTGDFALVVADRFVVEGQGRMIDMATLKQAVGAIDLNKLEGLKGFGSNGAKP